MLEYKPIRLQIVQEAAVKLGPIFNTPAEAADYLTDKAELQKEPEEVFVMLAMDTKNRLLGAFEVSRGNLHSSLVHPRELFKRALLVNAAGIIIAHNHPSGDLTPSQNDLETTKRLAEAGDLLGVEVLDHLIVGPCAFTGSAARFYRSGAKVCYRARAEPICPLHSIGRYAPFGAEHKIKRRITKMDLKKLSREQMIELKDQIVAELATRPDGQPALVTYSHNCINRAKHHKNKYKHWAKHVTGIDASQATGYAYKGDWLSIDREHKLPVGAIVVEVCDRDITAYRLTDDPDRPEIIGEANTNKMSDLITTLAALLN